MNTDIRDKTEEISHELKGNVREIAGKQSDSPRLEVEGAGDNKTGIVQKNYGPFKRFMEN
jgi:uncharacterized protein YjbJ (UPF0337 family)